MIRRLLVLAGLAWLVRRLVTGRTRSPAPALVGFEDGSSVVLDRNAPEIERLAGVAAEALAP